MRYRVITGTLEARTAVHVGSGEGNELADSLLRRDTEGNVLIPGTAIAGALRGMLTRLAPRLGGGICLALLPEKQRAQREQKGCDCAVCRLFGDVEPSDEEAVEGITEDQIHSAASRLLVFNAPLVQGTYNPPVIRDGVGIDRPSGSAARAAAAKFAVETLPAGAEFKLRMELRSPDAGERVEDEQLLAAALAEWQAGRAHLGGDVARGLGAFTLQGLQYAEHPLDEAKGLMAFLDSSTPWETAQPVEGWLQRRVDEATARIVAPEELPHDLPFSRGWAKWTFTLEAKGPFLTNDATSAGISGFDHAPLLAKVGDWEYPILAGSSLRGVLRAHAERIARTLATRQAMKADDPTNDFLHRCPACDPLARTATGFEEVPLESCDSLLRYRLGQDENQEVHMDQLCLACRLFGSTRNGSRLVVEDAPHIREKSPKYKMLDFLAIDRFTGGGAEHFKFDAVVLWQPQFQVRIFLEDPQDWELGWLTLVLRDLAEGWLRVGFGAAKGFGKIVATEITLHRGRLDAAHVEKGQPSIYTVDEQRFGDWSAASAWVEAFVEQVERFERVDKMDLPADSYFGAVDHIYEGGV